MASLEDTAVNLDALKASVAMCTFNGAEFVATQLESILAQSRPPDEIILCDDGSTDATVEIAEKIAHHHPDRIRIFRNERRLGYLRNFEAAINRTRGDVVFLSDQDDFWFPNKAAVMLRPFAEDSEVVLVYSDAELTDRELRPTGRTVFDRRKGIQRCKGLTLRQLSRAVPFNGPMVAFHSRLKPYVIPICPLSTQWGHDHWIGFIAYAIGNIEVIDHPLVYYRRHGKNAGGDSELDGGLFHQWKSVKRVYSGEKGGIEYRDRRRGWEDMVGRLLQIRNTGSPLKYPARLDKLLKESELCLQFAQAREALKKNNRSARIGGALRLLFEGSYHRHARGAKSLIQDLVIP